uniref:uncharacterized protein LOC120327163 n=1 Tax=Styela clava TaxID=7725 RepID=UPI00193AD865|nr:uncharacterized protein LOC120327163 [Styela clava]
MSFEKVIAKVNEHTKKCTDFYDLAEHLNIFEKKLNVDVTPQLKKVEFYGGGRIPDYEYSLEKTESLGQYSIKENEIKSDVKLDQVLNDFRQGHICLVGPAGCGKTTLMKATSKKVLDGKYFRGIIKMVQCMECGMFNKDDKLTASEFIFTSSNLTKEETGLAVTYTNENPDKVLFMIDSLDTLTYSPDGVYEIIDISEPAYPEVIVWNLLSGNLFPGCCIISSTREHAIRNYRGEVRPGIVIALAGLSIESIKEIIAGYGGNEEAEKTVEYLKTKAPLLLLLCTTPVMLVFTLISLKINPDLKPRTMTGIMVLVMQCILRSPHFLLEKVSEDFHSQHQSILEFLHALNILRMDLESFKEMVAKDLHTSAYVFVREMVCGLLLDCEVFEMTGILLEGMGNLKEKQSILRTSLRSQLKNTTNASDYMELLNALNEAKDGIDDIIGSSLHRIHLSNYPLTMNDAYVISSVASLCRSLAMNLSSCNLNSNLLKIMETELKDSKVEIKVLLLNGNKDMGIKGLLSVGRILSNQSFIDELNLSNCNISWRQLKAFKSTLGNTEIEQLDLSGKRIASHKDVVAVANLLPNITKDLFLDGWEIKNEDKEILQIKWNEISSEKLLIWLPEEEMRHESDPPRATPEQTILNTDSVLPKIKNFWSQVSGSTILLTWNEVLGNDILYKIEVFCDDVKLKETLTTSFPQCGMKSPMPGRQYRFQVWAEDSLGNFGAKTQSKNVIKIENIGIEGGSMILNECDITFPPGTFNKQTVVSISAALDNSICPDGYICVSPVFNISAESKFLNDATMRIKSWCFGSNEVDILHFSPENTWSVIKPDQISNDGIIEFRCREFSPVTAALKWLVGMIWRPQIVVDNRLYILNGNEFHFTFYAKSETARDDVRFYYKELGAQLAPVWFDPVVLKSAERVRIGVQIQLGPENVQMQQVHLQFDQPHVQFTCNEEFLLAQRHNFTFRLFPKLQEFPERIIECRIDKNEIECGRRNFTFPLQPIGGDQAGQRPMNFYGDFLGEVHMMGQGNEHVQQVLQEAQNEQIEANEQVNEQELAINEPLMMEDEELDLC